jgi:chromosome segregation ATPase
VRKQLRSHDFHVWCAALVAAQDGQMSDNDSIAFASQRLAHALDALEAAADRRGELDRGQDALVTQIHALGTDRARLASELDHATARSRGLETATREVARRVDQAIDAIRGVLTDDK